MKTVVVFITASGMKEARVLARTLVREKHVACVNLIPKIESIYWWKGKVETTGESLLILKTTRSNMKGLVRRVKQLHSYSVPEVIALPIAAGNPEYLSWVAKSCSGR